MKEPKFKVGDWCFCEYELRQVKRTEEDCIREVSDGYLSLSSQDLSDRCYPLEMDVKIISDEINSWNNEFHSLKNNALNHPDLNRKLVDMWCQLCNNRKDENKLKELYEELSKFGNAVMRKIRDMSFEEVEGIRLIR